MLKIKDDVPLINLIDMGYTCEYSLTDRLHYRKLAGGSFICIPEDTRKILCIEDTKFIELKTYDHRIRDLVQKQYVEELK